MNWNKYLAITAVFLTAIGIAFAGMVWKVNEMAESEVITGIKKSPES